MFTRSYAIGIVTFLASAAALAEDSAPPLVTVTGVGEVKVAPDEVLIGLLVGAVDKDIVRAFAETSAKAGRVLEAVRKCGVEDRDIFTEHVGIEPAYEYAKDSDNPVFVGYRGAQELAVTLRDLSKYEGLLADLAGLGVERLRGATWRTSRAIELRAEARVLAVKSARDKAAALAGALGQSIGAARRIDEGPPASATPAYRALPAQNAMAQAPDGDAGVAPGQISVTAVVTVGFELLPPQK